ncbi:ABC transporter permease subunit [candidate division KSB1 bacterium]
MLKHIINNEILDHIKSLRFMLTFILLFLLMTISAFLYIPEYNQKIDDFMQNRNKTLAQFSDRASQRAGLFFVFSFNYNGPWIYKTPNHLSFISEGQDENLPNAFQPSAFKVYGPSKRIRSNILLWRINALDWALIIGFVLSFTSLILVYDRISGERENGTLRLYLSNPVSRSIVLLGKFLGGFACLSISLLISMLMHIIILLLFGNIPFASVEWIIIGIAFLVSLLYISVFLMLGLFISSRTKESATSLVVALLCWAMFVIVIPRTGGLIASQISQIPTGSKAYGDANKQQREARESYDKENPEVANAGLSGHWSPGEPLGRALAISDAWSEVMDDYRNQMINQVELARTITLMSPYSCFSQFLEKLAESGIAHYKSFFDQVRDYKLTMREHLLDIYPLPLKWNGWNESMRTVEYEKARQKMLQSIDFDSIPKFEEKRTGFIKILSSALIYFLLLILFNILFFAGAFVSFIKYDVR